LTQALRGLRMVVSAGPTYEDIDPVRFLGNRSSGKMGFAIAAAAARRGADVLLIAGPVSLTTPERVQRIDVRSATQMHAAVLAALPADVYIGAAAVADFTPRAVSSRKLKKSAGQPTLQLDLVRTPDILADVAAQTARPRLVVGFAAETHDLADNARTKLRDKRVDLIVANTVGVPDSGFEGDDNALTVFAPDGVYDLGSGSKARLAETLLDLLEARLIARDAQCNASSSANAHGHP
jgi:phosphopantothenoylcysteine decarboxylase/phosphopantothenate--cysteine ligase